MTPPALSVAVYGAYLLLNAVGLVVAPALPLEVLGLPAPSEPWARLFGLVAGEIGFYFVFAARMGLASFFQATVYGRAVAVIVFVGLVVARLGPVQLLMFAAVDALSAVWTQLALRRQSAA